MASNKIEKILEEISNLTVMELADCVKAFEDRFGVSPIAVSGPMPAASAGAAEGAQKEEKTEYKVTLKDGGPEKIKVIKVLRSLVTDLNLSDAKKAAETPGYVVAESAPKDLAAKMKKELEEVGAKVELE